MILNKLFSTSFSTISPAKIPPLNIQISTSLKNLTSSTPLLQNTRNPNFLFNPSRESKPPNSLQTKHLYDNSFNCSVGNKLESPDSEHLCSQLLYICNLRCFKEGVLVHSPIIKLGFQGYLFLNNNLLSLYSKCFGVDEARKLFDGMSQRDVVSWTGIISAYVREGDNEDALGLFDLMVGSGIIPNEFTYSSILRSCSSLREFERGIRVQTQIIKLGFGSNPILGSALIDLYSKCDKPTVAYEIFMDLNYRDMVSWTTIISASVQSKDYKLAFRLYSSMIEERIPPNEFTFVQLLMASSFLSSDYGKLIHAHVILWGTKLNLVLKTALVDMYSKFLMMGEALKVAKQTPESDVLLWTAMISGYSQLSDFEEAINTFCKMKLAGISPNHFAYAGILNACSSITKPELGVQIHSRVVKAGLEHEVSVGNALLDMYMKCFSTVEAAMNVFKRITSPNVVSWTSLISGFSQHGATRDALQAFTEMRAAGTEPNCFTLSAIIKSCSTREALSQVRKVHAYIFKTNKFESHIIVGNSLVDAYAKIGMVGDAWNVINMMTHRDVITYTSLASGFNQMGHCEMALRVMPHMHADDVKMDGFSMASFLSASASLAAMETGKQLHCCTIKSGLDCEISVSNGLIDMYGKCGNINDARRAFTGIPKPNIVSWNGLISGLASNGKFSSALSGFEDMRLAGTQPDHITFLLVLYACSHAGLVDLGLDYFNSMTEQCNISPQLDHYVCLIDLLGRSGLLEEAVGVIETMPFDPDALIFKTLLGSCKIHGNLALGEQMANRALELDPSDPAVYVLLSNMYKDAGRLDSSEQTRRMMIERGVKKNPGQSWMEIRNKVYLFTAGDRSNPETNEMHEKIESLKSAMKSLGYGYVENVGSSYHSEKLAIAFGLLNVSPRAPIRIMKNIRICGDCHTFIKLVTQLVDREVVVRDGNRFHLFKNGHCSCGGYW